MPTPKCLIQQLQGSWLTCKACCMPQVRQEVQGLLAGEVDMHRLALGLEHAHMHFETLCYALAQQRKLDFLAARTNSCSVVMPANGTNGSAAHTKEPATFYLGGCNYAGARVSQAGCLSPDEFLTIGGGEVSKEGVEEEVPMIAQKHWCRMHHF